MNTLAYLGARMREASSWGGGAAILLAVLHVSASPGLISAVLGMIAAIGGLVAVLAPEGGHASPPSAA